jgi:hypothetical protein
LPTPFAAARTSSSISTVVLIMSTHQMREASTAKVPAKYLGQLTPSVRPLSTKVAKGMRCTPLPADNRLCDFPVLRRLNKVE